jgi:DNA-binding NtrC family response regulator
MLQSLLPLVGPARETLVHDPMADASSPSIRLLIVDDDELFRETLARRFRRQGMTVTEAADAPSALAAAERSRWDVALLDLHLPGMEGVELLERLKARQPDLEVLLLTADSSIDAAIAAMKRGAYDYLTKPCNLPELEAQVEKAAEKARLVRREHQWVEQLRYESPRYRLVGSSPPMREVARLLERAARTDATVLVRGPSGTGKELVARALHFNSLRRERPLVTINCAALQEKLLESELFGHEKGSFSGAVQAKPGLFEIAEGGTLFIDEVAEMAAALQAKLLRVLEDGHYRRVGGTREAHADVRIVAATNKRLEQEIAAGRFREDLYYRLNVITVAMPPLRERREDIPELVEHLLTTRQVGPTRFQVQPEALRALQAYDWPGNVRELANVLERAQILGADGLITLDDLPEAIAAAAPAVDLAGEPLHLRTVLYRHVQEVLEKEQGNKVQAARVLGISRRKLYRLIQGRGLDDDTEQAAASEE